MYRRCDRKCGGVSHFAIYDAPNSGTTLTLLRDIADLSTVTVSTAGLCGTFSALDMRSGDYTLVWASNQTSVTLYGSLVTLTPFVKSFWQSGTMPVYATCGTWAGPGSPFPATCTLDTTTTPQGLNPWVAIYQ